MDVQTVYLVILLFPVLFYTSLQLQFPWATPAQDATESSASVYDLKLPDVPGDRVQEFLNLTVAGVDYPIFEHIPETNFSCTKVEQPGFYADPETGCQVYHRCDPQGKKFSFLCANLTIFDQLLLTCDFFWKVQCKNAVGFYNYANVHLYSQDELLQSPFHDQGSGR
ncbi:U-scoloptoxin(01)-Er1a-like [Paramacrobiotus metropolitanus]|uniref:U-scoloptoxin(01)-Er1a-like n=1 Tax=Paramacrobiotus metropolitanus TaxID=2943436 RepID=UPI0024462F5E|nr:U-scoloptoxin(01)-Er1a-like [Paramacrobiotus metropolitanus]